MSRLSIVDDVAREIRYATTPPYNGDTEVTIADIVPGDVVCFIHEYATGNSRQSRKTALVLAIREKFMDCVSLETGDFGRADTVSLTDRGLQPYERDGNKPNWNMANHTQTLGVHVPPTFDSPEQARDIKQLLDGITELQRKHEVTPVEPSLESLALDALLEFAVHGQTTGAFQNDLRPNSSAAAA